ncbi:putative reverse transcriptase zinc-binding domain-containing protein [Helianthus annuus]|nr:putative reverse transcriptase zinc-binding domain-containing protein [Helianthus annuus]
MLTKDTWRWELEDSGGFTVSSLKKLLQSRRYSAAAGNFVWNNWLPKKVGFVAWRAAIQRLPTADALRRRNINLADPMCRLCRDCLESIDHIFTACHFSQTVWQVVATWCHIQPIFAFHVKDLLDIIVHEFVEERKEGSTSCDYDRYLESLEV